MDKCYAYIIISKQERLIVQHETRRKCYILCGLPSHTRKTPTVQTRLLGTTIRLHRTQAFILETPASLIWKPYDFCLFLFVFKKKKKADGNGILSGRYLCQKYIHMKRYTNGMLSILGKRERGRLRNPI